jgi:hypothetical protein
LFFSLHAKNYDLLGKRRLGVNVGQECQARADTAPDLTFRYAL